MKPPDPLIRFRPALHDTAFLFDLDGTLIEIAALPQDVVAPPRLQAALGALVAASGGAVGIISGRRIAFIEGLLPGLGAPLAGVHGLELRLGGDGAAIRTEPGGGAGFTALRHALGPFLQARPGLTLEDKGLSIAIHFRARPELEAEVEAFAGRFTDTEETGLLLQRGKMVLEIRAAGPRKGDAVAAIMALPAFVGRRPLYFGDDVTDEHAFAAAAAFGGAGVFVGSETQATLAAARLPSPAAVLAFIEAMVEPKIAEERRAWR